MDDTGNSAPPDATRIARPPSSTAVEAREDTSLGPGTLVSHTYRIEELVARGGMGEVYRAIHDVQGTEHAVKVILPELARDPRIVELFRREASALREIRNDAVVSYDGIIRDEAGRLYIVTEFVRGPSLADIIAQRRLSEDEVLALFRRVAGGLAAAHRKGIVHRDVSPDNVILGDGIIDRAILIDFGIARHSIGQGKTVIGGDFAGKYAYASPEQLGMQGGDVDRRSDIYSLGLVLAAAAQGRPLDMGASHLEVLRSREAVPDLSGIPERLRPLIESMLQPDPARRPQSFDDLLRSELLDDAPPLRAPKAATAPPAPLRADPRPAAPVQARRRSPLLLLWAAVPLLAISGGAALYWQMPMSPPRTAAEPPVPLTPETAPAPAEAHAPVPTPAAVADSPSELKRNEIVEGLLPKEDDAPAPMPPGEAQVAVLPVAAPALDEALRAAVREVKDSLRCGHLAVRGSGERAAVSGFVSSQSELGRVREAVRAAAPDAAAPLDVSVRALPFCQYLAAALPAVTAGSAARKPRIVFSRPDRVYARGEPLVLRIHAPPDEQGFLQVDYIDEAGTVVHMLPNPLRQSSAVAPGETIILGEGPASVPHRTYLVDEPYGESMISAVWTREPLFPERREEVEQLADYARALAERLASEAHEGGAAVTVEMFETRARRGR